MHAIILPNRVDIYGAAFFSREQWESLLDDLKAGPIGESGKRITAAVDENGPVAFINRTSDLTDAEITTILDRYGIPTR